MTVTDTALKCRRCHGSGLEPLPTPPSTDGFTADQQNVLAALAEQGLLRAGANRHTLTGRQTLDDAYREIRVHTAEGTRLGISKKVMGEAVGVSMAQFYNILNGTAGTS